MHHTLTLKDLQSHQSVLMHSLNSLSYDQQIYKNVHVIQLMVLLENQHKQPFEEEKKKLKFENRKCVFKKREKK